MSNLQIQLQAFKRKGDIRQIFMNNLQHAKISIETLGGFKPTLFVVTDRTIIYIMLDTDFATERNCSPNDQVEPLLEQLGKMEDKFGVIEGYQVIGEAWLKVFKKSSMPKLKHGDIAEMAGRIEILTSVEIRRGYDRKFENFEIIRHETSDKVKEFKPYGDKNAKWDSTKFPRLPKTRFTWRGDVGNE
jgi:hypothetical protein